MIEKNKKTILFVEDEMHLRELILPLLEKVGYEVLAAIDGEIAWKILMEKKVNLVLLDLILPKMDGFEVLEKMKSQKETKNIPVVVLTNLEEKFDIEKALSYGVRAYLIKINYKPQEIVEKINEILG